MNARLSLVLTGALLTTLAFGQSAAPRPPETTPATLPGAETHIYRDLKPEPVRLHVFKPKNWRPGDRRPVFMWFFGLNTWSRTDSGLRSR